MPNRTLNLKSENSSKNIELKNCTYFEQGGNMIMKMLTTLPVATTNLRVVLFRSGSMKQPSARA
jgi:hypothetical protein